MLIAKSQIKHYVKVRLKSIEENSFVIYLVAQNMVATKNLFYRLYLKKY